MFPLSKEVIDWDFVLEVKVSIKHVINSEVKNIAKASLARML